MNIGTLRIVLLATVAGLGSAGAAQAQNLVTNGGFEQPRVGGSCCTTTPTDPLPGWTVAPGDVNVVTGSFNTGTGNRAFEGTQYLDLIGQGNVFTRLSQTLTTVVGTVYSLNFAYSNNAFAGATSRTATVELNGGSFDTVTHGSATASNLNWSQFSRRFTATGTSTVLSFAEADGAGNAGLLLDAVSVTAVPEPASWAMMIAGFGLVGGLARRRRRAVAFA